ncbi:MAG TPA: DUF1573 domain-containing protein [Cytophagales bacterium]
MVTPQTTLGYGLQSLPPPAFPMTNAFAVITLLAALAACNSPANAPDAGHVAGETQPAAGSPQALTRVEFKHPEYDFGVVPEGEQVSHAFRFTNTGRVPLVIRSATAQCGCTVPRKPETPIAPGKTGEIHVSFDSRGKVGNQRKIITVVANTRPEVSNLIIRGVVGARARTGG